MIRKPIRPQILKSLITGAVLLFYIGTPMLDSMVCADCVGHAPFQGEATISHLKVAHVDINYSSKEKQQSDSTTEPGHKSFCSICANVLMGTEVFSINPPVVSAQCSSPGASRMISQLHYSIDKPPQNLA